VSRSRPADHRRILGWTITLALVALMVVGAVWLEAGQDPCELPSRMIDGLTAECYMERRRAAQVEAAAVLAAYAVVVAAIVVAWLLSEPPPRHRKDQLMRRRVWSWLVFTLTLVALFLWSQTGVTID
jgi:hypothetical protein